MVNIRFLLYLFDKDKFFKILLGVSLFALIPLVDFFLLFKIAYLIGYYLSLSIMSAFTGIGLIILIKSLNKSIDDIKEIHLSGYLEKPFLLFIGTFPGAALIIIPGLITTLIGLICIIPGIRGKVGLLLTKKMHIQWSEIYEYFYILFK